MKRALVMIPILALLLAVPAIPQESVTQADLGLQVSKLKEQVAQQATALKEMQSWMLAQQGQAKALAKKIKEAEKKGFLLPAPHNDAKQALLDGLKGLADSLAGTKPDEQAGEGKEE